MRGNGPCDYSSPVAEGKQMHDECKFHIVVLLHGWSCVGSVRFQTRSTGGDGLTDGASDHGWLLFYSNTLRSNTIGNNLGRGDSLESKDREVKCCWKYARKSSQGDAFVRPGRLRLHPTTNRDCTIDSRLSGCGTWFRSGCCG